MTHPPVPELPPGLPPEYAEAYRRGFERAYREASGEPLPVEELEDLAHAEGEAEVERTQQIEGLDRMLAEAPRREYAAPVHRGPERDRRSPWLVPLILVGLLLTLLVGAYLAGLVFSSSVESDGVAEPDEVVVPESGGAARDEPTPEEDESAAGGGAYRGRVDTVAISSAQATCTAPASVDAAGNEVTYEPGRAFDGDLTTAWRCPGSGSGESLELRLPQELRVAEVGLVAGYAKTDPRNGADRYAENNRITKVRWTFPDGTAVEQELDGSPDNRELQTVRIRPVLAGKVVLEVLTSTPGSRNTVAISEVRIGTPAD